MNLSTSPTSSHHLTLDSLGFGLLPLTSGTPFLPIQEQPSCLQSLSRLHSFQEAILENYHETATFDTSSTRDCMPGGEAKSAQAGLCWLAIVLESWASCIYTQASPVAASLDLTEQVRNEHRWWPDFFFSLGRYPMAPGVLKMWDSVPLSPSTEKLWNSFPRTAGTIIKSPDTRKFLRF